LHNNPSIFHRLLILEIGNNGKAKGIDFFLEQNPKSAILFKSGCVDVESGKWEEEVVGVVDADDCTKNAI
jgi:hypothetical protein